MPPLKYNRFCDKANILVLDITSNGRRMGAVERQTNRENEMYKSLKLRVWFKDGAMKEFQMYAIDFNSAVSEISELYSEEITNWQGVV